MALMEWSDKLSVGVAQFDAEHRRLVGMVNDLFDAVQAGKGKEALGGILEELIAYTETHFANEEEIMREHGYDEVDGHKSEHELLTRQVHEIRRKYMAGASATLSMEVMNFLKNWLIKHIQGTDRKYSRFMNQHGML
jgi:hemerythrin